MRGLFKGLIYGFSSLCLIAQADVADYKLASWNMQGAQSGYGSNSKWVTGVKAIFSRDGIDIVALQESGAVPSSAIVLPIVAGQHPEIERRMPRSDIQVPVVSLVGGSDTIINPSRRGVSSSLVQEYLWNVGSSSRSSDFYIYHFDRGRSGPASRINLAIVSRFRAEEVIIVPPMTSGRNTRPHWVSESVTTIFLVSMPRREPITKHRKLFNSLMAIWQERYNPTVRKPPG
ncbi:endonuclease/exonuclease/phosphatase family protein [Yersinia enterocolitica]|uniref:endonuclease/exonuclease/phosphatase family protein n=1 Tax=Yersinia enterocolitica TaxID=630 RepID=UPI0005DE05B8|nr:endonuclease/exonuclease/phosphatase family protein [Yersinia enterocolitica]CQQ25885.1 cytolethal distending toxin subunit B [Yersinia enterocolitica]CRX42034.1 cytolethal distending toxin subunit B [Yersinia enterocolitica]